MVCGLMAPQMVENGDFFLLPDAVSPRSFAITLLIMCQIKLQCWRNSGAPRFLSSFS